MDASTSSNDAYVVSSPLSDGGGVRRATSDEEVILASNRPKRSAGRKKFRETRHPVYRGVRQRNNNKWVCEVREPNKKSRIWLGTFATAEMAARAHDVAALALRGRSACLNFADSVWRLPQPSSTDAKDIRKAATDAAEAFSEEGSCLEIGGEEELKDDDDHKNQSVFYFDEDREFGMPRLLESMAEGLLLSPPRPSLGTGFNWDELESTMVIRGGHRPYLIPLLANKGDD
ncbi:hypothetical protein Syun_012946 [Stephania yunnanensis]|uniref:AP2/ERF domain-containing protein n=1 Tax=Stephania yunnanensis TaxID=152371 RepID=A0AAP0PJX9_9MAGN